MENMSKEEVKEILFAISTCHNWKSLFRTDSAYFSEEAVDLITANEPEYKMSNDVSYAPINTKNSSI